ncbi:rRNA-processing protein UTP22 [Aspergillus clavatus NRRL 1]|uniref:U3 small nucleolar RNA-associated protein 22 n=1 Tax=Aspergillus clavatus (strain ATCC 1007 / CBS 513.65 / DSM 816 / NCTC 3887 / NRRL 1 / QM 1276 / 107) TaxID=344612 RepID=A1CJ23_ASPCL|nr:pre-rRNA processing protein Utp22 [Aspergillus clavatus NRRL 1]EAW09147.1 pre-rRNA processing protein Utp22 [Aspergillus clavatus NRRL 1]
MSSMGRKAQGDRSGELALASGLYKSSFFKLQLDELLTESRPNYDKQTARAQDILHKLKDLIERLPERPAKPAFEAGKELRSAHAIVVPFPEPRPSKDTKYSVGYARPSDINVVGSFALRTGARTTEKHTIDLAVTMPSTLFQEKDYVNYRFFHKRAYYIACIAVGIRDAQDLNFNVKFALQDGDSLRPAIILEPRSSEKDGSILTKSRIRIITAVEENLFALSRTLPLKNNIRHGMGENPGSDEPTPFYNAALRSEATVASYHKHIHSTIRHCDSFRDACLLGRIWLQQRGFASPFQESGFGGFEWTCLMSLLFEGGGANGKPILLKSYSSYQLFKATLQFLAGRDLTKPLILPAAAGIEFPTDGPVLFDGKRGLNILYKMTLWSYAFLRHEATVTLKMLNESRDDNFDKVFIVKANESMLRFDRVVALPSAESDNVLRAIRNQYAIYDVLKKALGDRAKLIHISSSPLEPWSVQAKLSSQRAKGGLSVGLLLNSENASRVVDHGPSAEQKEEAASFRSFWGEKAELRRFKDGSILESLVWSDQPSSKSIVYQILSYILRRHFNYAEEDIQYVGDEYEALLSSCGDGIISYTSPSFQVVSDAFNSLEKSIQNMEEVPLTVRHLAPAGPLLRYAALRVQPAPGVSSERVDVILQFESSARWPDDLVAIQMTKVAFLIKIGDSLESSGVATSCKVGLENESSRILNNAFLDVVHVSGVIFRLRIHHDREQTLLERSLKEKGVTAQVKQNIAYALSLYKRTFLQSPRLTQAIRTLCTRHPLLSPTIRLVKHWFHCHLFTGHLNEEVIELFAVRAFTQPYPWDAPSSLMVGFLRTLHLLSRWDWQQEPLMIDLSGQLDQNAVEAIRTRFSAWRQIDPAMNNVALFVASDIDPEGVSWTQYEMPSKVVAARLSILAKAAMKMMRQKGHTLNPSDLFQTSLAPYDFILNLRSKGFTDLLASSSRYKNLQQQVIQDRADKLSVVKTFVRDLQACFSPSALFFHGDEHCNVVAGLWNPHTVKPKNWSLKMTYSTSPLALMNSGSKGSDDVSINQTAILNEISRLGAGLIERIEVNSRDTATCT